MYTLHGIANAQNFNALIDKNKKRILERLDAGYYVSDFFAADLNTGPFYMLMMAPILGPDGNSAGIIVFEIRMSPVYRMILETTGLGKTGEILIAVKSGDTILFFNPMHSALPKTVGVAELFRDDKQLLVLEAFKGIDGQGMATDYRDKKVFAVWRHLVFVKWGLVTKIDVAEVMASANKLGSFMLIMLVSQ